MTSPDHRESKKWREKRQAGRKAGGERGKESASGAVRAEEENQGQSERGRKAEWKSERREWWRCGRIR